MRWEPAPPGAKTVDCSHWVGSELLLVEKKAYFRGLITRDSMEPGIHKVGWCSVSYVGVVKHYCWEDTSQKAEHPIPHLIYDQSLKIQL